MRKLSSSEFEQLPIRGKGRSSHVFNSIINLKPGEAMLIEKKDWTRKAGPSTLVRYIEKIHKMKFHFGALNGNTGWALKRIDNMPASSSPIAEQTKKDQEKLQLKSDLVVFYLGRMAFHKIERIEDSLRASVSHFWKYESTMVKELFQEIITALSEQGHIMIENEKTYIPLRRN
jgi:hypothetical protein